MSAGRADAAARCGPGTDGCHLCGDEAVPGRVLAVDPRSRTAAVAVGGGVETVALDLVEAGPGDVVLVHLGFAIARLEAP